MSYPQTRFGAFTGSPGSDVVVTIGGKGRKNILSVTASYIRQALAPAYHPAAPDASFQGRIVIVEGQIGPSTPGLGPPPTDFNILSKFDGQKVLFDTLLNSAGPHVFFYPIAQQEGGPQSDESAVVSVILCTGVDVTWTMDPAAIIVGNLYTPSLTVSGQTVFGTGSGGFIS